MKSEKRGLLYSFKRYNNSFIALDVTSYKK